MRLAAPVLTAVLEKRTVDAAPPLMDDPSADRQRQLDELVDQVGLEAKEHYQRTMGKWRRDVHDVVSDNTFWTIMKISSDTSQPLEHLEIFIMTNYGEGIASGSSVCEKLALLATGHAARIWDEFNNLIMNNRMWSETFSMIPKENCESLNSLAVLLLLHNAAGLRRRVISKLEECSSLCSSGQ